MSSDAIREAEQDVELKSNHLGRLRSEFIMNANTLRNSYVPKTAPLIAAVFQSSEVQKHLETRISWLEKKVVAMEQKRSTFFEPRDMALAKKGAFDLLNPRFEDAFASLEAVTKEELAVLRGYEHPPQVVQDTIQTVMLIRGEEDATWEASKIMLSETYYYSFFVYKARSRSKQSITPEINDALCNYCIQPDNVPENVLLISRPCGAMAKWLRVLRDFYQLQEITEPKVVSLEEVKNELLSLRLQLQQKKEDILGAEKRLAELRDDLEGQLADLRNHTDETLLPLQDLFFEAHNKFNEAYTSPKRLREQEVTVA
jgi:hypothetical protein